MAVAAGFPSSSSTRRVLGRNRMSSFGVVVLLCLIVVAVFGQLLSPYDPQLVGAAPTLVPPGPDHWMGSDELGHDLLSRVISGIRISMIVGLTSTLISSVVGIVVGAVAGFSGGFVDDLLMRVTELFMIIPRFFLALVFVAIFGATILNVIVSIGILSWPIQARIVRSEFLSLKSRQYVDAARVAGASTASLVFLEILPNALGPVIVAATLQVGQAMLIEASLAYLGLGDPNQVSLGLMLQKSQSVMRSAWWTAAFPGSMIFLAILSSNLVGDALNDLLNPRSRGR